MVSVWLPRAGKRQDIISQAWWKRYHRNLSAQCLGKEDLFTPRAAVVHRGLLYSFSPLINSGPGHAKFSPLDKWVRLERASRKRNHWKYVFVSESCIRAIIESISKKNKEGAIRWIKENLYFPWWLSTWFPTQVILNLDAYYPSIIPTFPNFLHHHAWQTACATHYHRYTQHHPWAFLVTSCFSVKFKAMEWNGGKR